MIIAIIGVPNDISQKVFVESETIVDVWQAFFKNCQAAHRSRTYG